MKNRLSVARGGGFLARGFSLIELLVVVAVIAIVAAVAVPNILNISSSARESAISLQEGNLNSAYRSLKATMTLPTNKEGILAVLATNTNISYIPPETMDGPSGTLTLAYNATTDAFAYGANAGDIPSGGPGLTEGGFTSLPPSSWSPPVDAIASNRTTPWIYGGQEAWFDVTPVTMPGTETYYMPQDGGLNFEPFRISLESDGVTGKLVTQSGQSFDLVNNEFIQYGDYQMHWHTQPGGGIKVSSVTYRPPGS